MPKQLPTRIGFVLFSALCVAVLAAPGLAADAPSLTRGDDPVITKGNGIPIFTAAPFDELFLYTFKVGQWLQIPWQFDEMKDGRYVASEDGELDGDDELAFMGADAGSKAPVDAWIADASSRTFSRYEIAVTDPLHPEETAWVYLYRSTTLTDQVTTDYVNYDPGLRVFSSDRFKLGMLPDKLGAATLEMNGSGVDILDRTKVRISTNFLGTLTEDDVPQDSLPVIHDGRVRAIAGVNEDARQILTIAYRSLFHDIVAIDLSAYPAVVVHWVRVSSDLSDKAIGGTYYDANVSAGVPVDGQPDNVPSLPSTNWWQLSGSTGTVVGVIDVAGIGGTPSNYYKDDATVDSGDTGDQRSYADSGPRVESPGLKISLRIWHYVLPANGPNTGAAIASGALTPLQAAATAQTYQAPTTPTPTATSSTPLPHIYLPQMLRG